MESGITPESPMWASAPRMANGTPIVCGLDVDGVLAGFAEYVCERNGWDYTQWTTWGVPEAFGPGAVKWLRAAMSDPATWVKMPVRDGAKEAVNRISRAGIPIVFISGFPPRYALLRRWWLEHHFGKYLPFRRVTLYQSKGEEKAGACRWLGITHFLEDRLETAEAIARAGVNSFLVPSPYMGQPSPKVAVATVREFAGVLAALARADRPEWTELTEVKEAA